MVMYSGTLSTNLCSLHLLVMAASCYHARNLLLTGSIFCWPLFLTLCFLNTVTIAAMRHCHSVLLLLFFLLPLFVIERIAGKNSKTEFQAPCRTTKYPREILPLPWYRGTLAQMAMTGFLPSSAIYIELYYIFACGVEHRIYTIYSILFIGVGHRIYTILFIVFIILLIVTTLITVVLTYFQLAAKDHEWWWRMRPALQPSRLLN